MLQFYFFPISHAQDKKNYFFCRHKLRRNNLIDKIPQLRLKCALKEDKVSNFMRRLKCDYNRQINVNHNELVSGFVLDQKTMMIRIRRKGLERNNFINLSSSNRPKELFR